MEGLPSPRRPVVGFPPRPAALQLPRRRQRRPAPPPAHGGRSRRTATRVARQATAAPASVEIRPSCHQPITARTPLSACGSIALGWSLSQSGLRTGTRWSAGAAAGPLGADEEGRRPDDLSRRLRPHRLAGNPRQRPPRVHRLRLAGSRLGNAQRALPHLDDDQARVVCCSSRVEVSAPRGCMELCCCPLAPSRTSPRRSRRLPRPRRRRKGYRQDGDLLVAARCACSMPPRSRGGSSSAASTIRSYDRSRAAASSATSGTQALRRSRGTSRRSGRRPSDASSLDFGRKRPGGLAGAPVEHRAVACSPFRTSRPRRSSTPLRRTRCAGGPRKFTASSASLLSAVDRP